ncbi:MAG: hypothetical protein JWP67_249 [Mucilaginibacter sp.]|nr:hypothetical protein [Mucilaginibacter sp.]
MRNEGSNHQLIPHYGQHDKQNIESLAMRGFLVKQICHPEH